MQSASVGGAAVDRASISRSLPATSVAHAEFTRETREGDQRTAVGGEMPRPRSQSVKRVAFEGVGGMEITSTLHVVTHLDAPNHFITNARGIGELRWTFSLVRRVLSTCRR